MNSKAEFNRCRVPRLVIDPEVWKKKSEQVSIQLEEEDPLVTEAEESLSEKEQLKRKKETPEEKRKKKRKFCLLEN